MQQSPRGNTIEEVEGSPDAIIQRGNAITALGEMMEHSATILEQIKTRATEGGAMEGKAIAALNETIGDSFETLKKSGELYKPVGPVIATYGEALKRLQPQIAAVVGECEELWRAYQSMPAPLLVGRSVLDPGSELAQQWEEQEQEKQDAYDAWYEKAEEFDRLHSGASEDSWEGAFNDAVNGIEQAMSDGIKDSRWAGFFDALDFIVEVLEALALIAAVLALLFAGPFALIALGLAAAILAVRVVQMFDGDKSLGERFANLGWAVFGVLPFGKFADEIAGANKLVLMASSGDEVTRMAVIMSNADDLLQYGPAAFRHASTACKAAGLLQHYKTAESGLVWAD